MPGSLMFVLPDGYTVEVADPPARLICDRLWDQGIAVGAATAAARISEALNIHHAFRPDVTFNQREVNPLIEAAQAHPPTWTLLLQRLDLTAVSASHRERLLEVCDELSETLSTHRDPPKVRTLVSELNSSATTSAPPPDPPKGHSGTLAQSRSARRNPTAMVKAPISPKQSVHG